MCHQRLSHLRLNGTNVSNTGLAELAVIQSLELVEMIDTQVTETGCDSYKAASGEVGTVLEKVVGGVL